LKKLTIAHHIFTNG